MAAFDVQSTVPRAAPQGASELRSGTVAKLNRDAGFGYVDDSDGLHRFIFVAGYALRRAEFGKLRLGSSVLFRTSGQGRVDELVLAAS